MGGCCCCCCCCPPEETELSDPPPSFNVSIHNNDTELSDPPPSFNNPGASEEPVLLSSDHGSASASSGGPLVDANLETSTPDTKTPPPAPVPSSSDTMAVTQTLLSAREISDNKTNASLQSANPNSAQDIASTSDGHGDLEETELDSAEDSENELQNVEEPVNLAEEKDGCPICLDGYDAVDPKLSIKCGHHFHLACILDWRERKSTCPVCERDIVFDPPID